MTGGDIFQFMHNSIEVINDLVFDIMNFKNIWITGNNMGFSLKSPNALAFFDEGKNGILVHGQQIQSLYLLSASSSKARAYCNTSGVDDKQESDRITLA